MWLFGWNMKAKCLQPSHLVTWYANSRVAALAAWCFHAEYLHTRLQSNALTSLSLILTSSTLTLTQLLADMFCIAIIMRPFVTSEQTQMAAESWETTANMWSLQEFRPRWCRKIHVPAMVLMFRGVRRLKNMQLPHVYLQFIGHFLGRTSSSKMHRVMHLSAAPAQSPKWTPHLIQSDVKAATETINSSEKSSLSSEITWAWGIFSKTAIQRSHPLLDISESAVHYYGFALTMNLLQGASQGTAAI